MNAEGLYPFGSKLKLVTQTDRTPKKVFVLGVYASAVHARWTGADGKVIVQALAVASEPCIFWDGSNASDIIAKIPIPAGLGRLEPAAEQFNGPSGRSLDNDFLKPLGLSRNDAWLCDLLPHTCLNAGQSSALKRYAIHATKFKLNDVTIPKVPDDFADDRRRSEILDELEESRAKIIVVLGDQPIRCFLNRFDPSCKRLSAFGDSENTYGRLHPVSIKGVEYAVLPLAHPRQVGGLGTHSPKWRKLHNAWKLSVASMLIN